MMTLPRWIATIAFAACTLAAAAVPTVDAVQAEVQRGNFAQAETMMQQVIAARPGSARAHYIYAEILARNKRFDQAATEVARARQIDPAIGFTDPAKFGALEQLLQREQAAARPVAVQPAPTGRALPAPVQPTQAQPVPTADSGVPSWAWALGLGGLAALAWSLLRRRPQPVAGAAGPMAGSMGSMAGPVGAGGAPQGYGQAPAFGQTPAYGQPPGYGQAPGYAQPSGMGGGLMGVGLAAAGGVAAGMLVEKLLHGGHDSAAAQAVNPAANPAASGLVPGLFDEPADNAAARELEQRPVDFGSGGSAADSADGGWGGGDSGGSDDSSDGW